MISPPLLALAAASLFGAAVVLSKPALREMSPLAGALTSVPTTAVLLWALSPFLLDLSGATVSAVGIFAAVGLVFPAVVTLLNFESNRLMGPTLASTVSSTAPLFAVVIAILFLHERLTLLQAAGTGAIVGGVMVLSISQKGRTRNWPLWALALPLCGAFFRGGAQAVIKAGLALWQSAFAAALAGYTVSTAVLLAAAALSYRRNTLVYRARALPKFALVGVCNGAGLLLGYEALRRGQVSQVAPILATFPLFTFFLGAIFLHDERVTLQVLTGVLMTVAGVVVMTAH